MKKTKVELEKFENMLPFYESASDILMANIEIIKSQYKLEEVHSDIQNIKHRIKSMDSIEKKLEKNNLDFTLENILNNVRDVIGFRVVCLNINDVFAFVDLIKKSNLEIIVTKDYITNPKDSGYRSYHIIVNVPINYKNMVIPAEIQVRTLTMDLWASYEHEIVYKNKDCSEANKKKLRDLSGTLSMIEDSMNIIRNVEVPKKKVKK